MSQAKVDRYKKEKQNRAKVLKKKKRKRFATIIILACLVGAAIGVPLGRYLYDRAEAKKAANATITAEYFPYMFDEYYTTHGYSESLGFSSTVDTDSLLATVTDATVTDASSTDAE